MEAKEMSKETLLGRWEDVRDIRNLMGKMAADYVLREERSMFEKYWSKRADISLGVNEGFYIGPNSVSEYYNAAGKAIEKESKKIKSLFPKELGEKTDEEVYGVGMMNYKPVDSYVIEEALDGKTAKGIWMIRGSHSKLSKKGPVAYWEWGYFAADFVLEDDNWKIWHLQYLKDIDSVSGFKWSENNVSYKDRDEFKDWEDYPLPKVDKKYCLREYYNKNRKHSPSPRLPEPYDTFENTFSYGAEGVM
ncbi:MAG: nuclear transport factor 2 family protein [Eubacterium sp.]|nr:nuclear transport factor 2 family protein [Eubacterium sp.]